MLRDIKTVLPINDTQEGNQAVSGRDLHRFLEVRTRFSDWIKRSIDYGMFDENVDFTVFLKNEKDDTGFGGHRRFKDYAMTLDMAKEVAMMQRTERGKQARKYFIQVEKEYKHQVKVEHKPMTAISQLRLATKSIIEIDDRVSKLESNQTINPGEYSYLNSLVSKQVYSYANNVLVHYNRKQIKELYKDISNGIKQVSNIKTRSQLRAGQYNSVIDYVTSWVPSTATKQVVKSIQLDLGDEDDD